MNTQRRGYIRFIDGLPKPKTKTWLVVPIDGPGILGTIAWYGQWRAYSFFLASGTVFERCCLRDIADFCAEQTVAHRKRRIA